MTQVAKSKRTTPDRPRKRPAKTTLRAALIASGGVVSNVAEGFNVSRQTIYDWIAFYKLNEQLNLSRETMYDVAVDNILMAVEKNDLEMSRFVVTHMPTRGRARWSNRQEITGANGSPLNATPELVALMARAGISGDELVAELEMQLRREIEPASLPADAKRKKKRV
ncbi:MAG: hypothetical protein L6Q98_23565 [Anaerolineae bacterium]|nr:hypothetical protein [Anaerolineae bacterium]NUQ06367.1 hypothetical protein [Anaerolineae bacterium]